MDSQEEYEKLRDSFKTELLPVKGPVNTGYLTVILGEEEFREWMVAANMDMDDDSSWLSPETYIIKPG